MLSINDLASYQISAATGFVPVEDPLDRLPTPYEPWEMVMAQMGGLLMNGRLRAAVAQLPHLSVSHLESEREIQRAMLLLSVIGNGYVWNGAEPSATLPAQIAVPWCELSEKLGRPPIVAHQSMVLNNWQRLDKTAAVTLDNVTTQALFLGGMDERWFYLVTLQIELDGAAALPALIEAQTAVAQQQPEQVTTSLQEISAIIKVMLASLARMTEKCDPYIFYHRVRPFLAGWPEPGLIYEGVSPEPQLLSGGSAAQSSLIQALDAGLGVVHTSEKTRPFLQEMRSYMPRPHREFLLALEAGPSIAEFVNNHRETHPLLVQAYNKCIAELDKFRRKHIEISVRYIVHQAPESEEAKGTGGTSFVPFLSEARKETKRQMMAVESP